MNISKLKAGAKFPVITVEKLGGGEITLSTPSSGFDWKLVVVYRGKHCPICTRYLGELNDALSDFNALGIDVVAVSADPQDKTTDQMALVNPNFDVGYNLTIEQMQKLGLYISQPRSAQETDRPFAEPGLFLINGDGNLQVIDISNAPFARPDLKSLLKGFKFIRNPENNYPIRGTHTAA
ncbi:MAG: AhpC/TSA family protein [Rhodospirillales bacterium]|nr:AhpC/TSA family protein [Rhodospirillales bacterium]